MGRGLRELLRRLLPRKAGGGLRCWMITLWSAGKSGVEERYPREAIRMRAERQSGVLWIVFRARELLYFRECACSMRRFLAWWMRFERGVRIRAWSDLGLNS